MEKAYSRPLWMSVVMTPIAWMLFGVPLGAVGIFLSVLLGLGGIWPTLFMYSGVLLGFALWMWLMDQAYKLEEKRRVAALSAARRRRRKEQLARFDADMAALGLKF